MSSLTNSTADYSIANYTNFIAAILIFLVGVFGFVCNSVIILFFWQDSEKTSFKLICLSRAIVNSYILLTSFLGVFLPSTILGYSPYSQVFETWNLNLSMTLYLGNEYQIALVAVNRFSALFFPRTYSKMFSIRPTLLILTVFYGYRLAINAYLVGNDVARGCFYSFSIVTLSWSYPPDPTCLFVDNIMFIILATFIGCTCLNVVSFVKIIKFYLSINSHDKETQTRIKKNAVIFFQTVLQDSLYIVDLSFTYKLSELSNDRFWRFLSGTLVWECLHSVDGFIMLMFNERFTLLRARRDPPTNSSVIVPMRPPVATMGSVA